jgi:hypothetical protein
MSTEKNYQQAEIHFDHVFSRRKGDSLPIVIRPIDLEKDRFAAKQMMTEFDGEQYEADGTEESLANLNNTVDAKNFLRDAQKGYSNPNNKNPTWAITIKDTTIGFVGGYPFPDFMYLTPKNQGLGIELATHGVMTDFATTTLAVTAKDQLTAGPNKLLGEFGTNYLTNKKALNYTVVIPE